MVFVTREDRVVIVVSFVFPLPHHALLSFSLVVVNGVFDRMLNSLLLLPCRLDFEKFGGKKKF